MSAHDALRSLADSEEKAKQEIELARELLHKERLQQPLAVQLQRCLKDAGLPENIEEVEGRLFRLETGPRGKRAPYWQEAWCGRVKMVSVLSGTVLSLHLPGLIFDEDRIRFDCANKKIGWYTGAGTDMFSGMQFTLL